jgi:gluconate 2-dehydrogenase gamma chain
MQITALATATGPVVSCTGSISPWRSLTEDEARTLEAIVDRVIPADQDPGAAWAGVVNFVDKQLAGPYRRLRKTYRLGLAGTNETSVAMFGGRFAELSAERRDKVLSAIEKGHVPGAGWKGIAPSQFFDLVLNHTLEGFYGDPRHGGNRERVSWRMLRLPYPPVRGRLQGLGTGG